MASKMAAKWNICTEYAVLVRLVFILSCKLILYCIVMCRYDLRPLLEHSEPKMSSKMAVSVRQQPYGLGWHTYLVFILRISRPFQKQNTQL